MKFCSRCGAQVVDEAVVCVNCGCSLAGAAPSAVQLKTNRGLLNYILLSAITFGI